MIAITKISETTTASICNWNQFVVAFLPYIHFVYGSIKMYMHLEVLWLSDNRWDVKKVAVDRKELQKLHFTIQNVIYNQ